MKGGEESGVAFGGDLERRFMGGGREGRRVRGEWERSEHFITNNA